MTEQDVRGIVVGERAGVGSQAPDFELPALVAGVKKPLRLSSYRGKNVVLAFYPYNWQEASAKELTSFQMARPSLPGNAEIIAITVDSIMNTTTWEREIGPFEFPICADFWPHGAVCAQYGVLRESGIDAGASENALFVIDGAGRVVFRKVYQPEEAFSLDDAISVLEEL